MPISVPDHLVRGAISGEAEAQSVIRWVAWLNIGLTVALFVFLQILSFWVNALADLTTDDVISECVFFLIVLTPPAWMLVGRGRVAALAMLGTALFTGTMTGAFGLSFVTLQHRSRPDDIDVWPLAFAAFTFALLGMTVLAWRAFVAATLLKRLASGRGAALIAREFD